MKKTEMMETIEALNAKVSNQAEIIRKLNSRNDEQHAYIVKLELAHASLERVIRRVMSKLALQNVFQNTHAGRNAENRAIILDMKYWHDKPVDSYSSDIPRVIADDIPF